MERRHLLAGLAASALYAEREDAATPSVAYLEVKTWRLHNSPENQLTRVADYLQHGVAPALTRSGGRLVGAFANVIGQDGPYYFTVALYESFAAIGEALNKLRSDKEFQDHGTQLASGSGHPFVRVESSILRCFDNKPRLTIPEKAEQRPLRIFELRTYESQSFAALTRKVGMFNNGEMQIFERLGMRPIFFGETVVGPKQPNIMYLLSYDSLAARDELWHAFGSDPEWRKLSGQPELKDEQIVANISNVILRPLPFSEIR